MKFHDPTTIAINGCTSSGKSYLLFKILKNKDQMFENPPTKVLYCYGIWTKLYDEMELMPFISFHEGVPTMEDVKAFADGTHVILVLDDLMNSVSKSVAVQDMFTLGSHHLNVTIIYLTQNMFQNGSSSRTIALNTHVMILMKNPRGKSQISTLASQTGLGWLVESYNDATKKPYGYVVLNLSPHVNDDNRVVTHIFPSEYLISYRNK